MGWTYRCVENASVTMRCTLISRNLVEKPALSRPPCSAVLKTSQTGPSNSPSVTRAAGRITKLSFPTRVPHYRSRYSGPTPVNSYSVHITLDGIRMVQGRHCAARTSSSCLSAACLRASISTRTSCQSQSSIPRGTPLSLPSHPQTTYLPRFVPGEWLTQELFNALYTIAIVLQPKEIRHTQHLTI